jgi:hypothetical protein
MRIDEFHVVFTVHIDINFQIFNQEYNFLFSYFCSINPTYVSTATRPSSGVHW